MIYVHLVTSKGATLATSVIFAIQIFALFLNSLLRAGGAALVTRVLCCGQNDFMVRVLTCLLAEMQALLTRAAVVFLFGDAFRVAGHV